MPRVHEYCDWFDDDDEDDIKEYRRLKIQQRRRQQALMKHPSCDDPDHPGCKNCNQDVAKEENQEE